MGTLAAYESSHQAMPNPFNPLHQARDETLPSTAAQATAVIFLTHSAMSGTPLM